MKFGVRSLSIVVLGVAAVALLVGCSPSKRVRTVTTVEPYHVAYRQTPPAPVYGRLTWSHLPQPVRPKSRETAPLLMPVLSFELPKTNVGEAIQALAQTIGYEWTYPPEASRRPIAINMAAPVDEILAEIGRQGQVVGVLDHGQRLVRVIDRAAVVERPEPILPEAEIGQSARGSNP